MSLQIPPDGKLILRFLIFNNRIMLQCFNNKRAVAIPLKNGIATVPFQFNHMYFYQCELQVQRTFRSV